MKSSRQLLIVIASFVLSAGLLGCPLLKKSAADAGAEEESVADAATVTVGGSGAKNERDVLRYAKEQKLADEAAVVAKDGVEVKTFPGGAEVATLSKGTVVVKHAKYFSTGVLVSFDDPEGGRLMGWVTPDAVVAPTAASTATAAPKPVVVAPKVDAGTTKPVDAGSAPSDAGNAPVDAGKPTVVDAGAPADAGKPTTVVDAGLPAAPGAAVLVMQPTGGKCPVGFTLMGPLCRRPCKADTECPRTTVCKVVSGQKACTNP